MGTLFVGQHWDTFLWDTFSGTVGHFLWDSGHFLWDSGTLFAFLWDTFCGTVGHFFVPLSEWDSGTHKGFLQIRLCLTRGKMQYGAARRTFEIAQNIAYGWTLMFYST